MKRTLGWLGKAVIFLGILSLLLAPLSDLTIRKSLTGDWDMTNKIGGFFNEPEDEFEVMFFGSSHAYAAFSPLRLWENTGVKSYVFATQQQPVWATYAYLKQALKTQSPSLVVVECNMLLSNQDYFDDGVTYSYMDELPMSWDKVRLAWESAPDMTGRVEALFSFIKYHGRWSELTETDWAFDRSTLHDPLKGHVALPPQSTPRPRPEIETVTAREPITEKNQLWLEKIIDLCADEGIDLWLVKSPSNLSPEEKARLNTVSDRAEAAGVPFTDYNEAYAAMGLREDLFYDEHHLDARGAALFTDWFARELTERCPDLSADREDAAWAADAADYEARLEAMG